MHHLPIDFLMECRHTRAAPPDWFVRVAADSGAMARQVRKMRVAPRAVNLTPHELMALTRNFVTIPAGRHHSQTADTHNPRTPHLIVSPAKY